ncbi:MAG TPA: hypothetical protein VKE95_13115 [Burkholderiales bacterium]|nr:hypothetical protein [Burkholderiales bacterium]
MFLAALIAMALSFPAVAQTSPQLVKRYTDLAGSAESAKTLVNGLAQKMALGNVDNALALTQASLEKRGIDHPTPEQLKVALTALLDQRAAGEGWGEIAHSLGFSLGEIKDAQDQREQAERIQRAQTPAPNRVDKPGAERPLRPERPDRSTRPDRPERPQI